MCSRRAARVQQVIASARINGRASYANQLNEFAKHCQQRQNRAAKCRRPLHFVCRLRSRSPLALRHQSQVSAAGAGANLHADYLIWPAN